MGDLRHVDIEKPRYDQTKYWGRAKHFFIITNPLNIFATEAQLDESKKIVDTFRNNKSVPKGYTEDQLWRAKNLYDSAFHPDTGEKMNVIGRMSAQVPMNMTITGAMMVFYKSTPAVIFWQWFNQSFNALVNYTNRSGDAPISEKQLFGTYVLATGGALATALTLNNLVKNFPPVVGRLVPFAAVASANCINIPSMRLTELLEGTPILDENDNRYGLSKSAARSGIFQVALSRIAMAVPGMMCTPFIMSHLEAKGTLARYPYLGLPLQVGMVGVCLTFATPMACAFFKQKAEIKFHNLEAPLQEKLKKEYGSKVPQTFYYNKGL